MVKSNRFIKVAKTGENFIEIVAGKVVFAADLPAFLVKTDGFFWSESRQGGLLGEITGINGLLFEITPVGIHIALWLYILGTVGLIFLFSRFEIRTLKYKFNIK